MCPTLKGRNVAWKKFIKKPIGLQAGGQTIFDLNCDVIIGLSYSDAPRGAFLETSRLESTLTSKRGSKNSDS